MSKWKRHEARMTSGYKMTELTLALQAMQDQRQRKRLQPPQLSRILSRTLTRRTAGRLQGDLPYRPDLPSRPSPD